MPEKHKRIAPGSVPVIGIVGGVASGKSTVADAFCELGAARLDGDRAGHQALRLPDVKRAIRRRWGEGVFGEDGEIDRSALGRIVFAPPPEGPAELEALEEITHPRIGEILREQAAQLAARPEVRAIVLDAAVMVKAGWDRLCDRLVFVDVPREVRLRRALERGWTEEQFAAREAAQELLEEKRRRSDAVVDNSGSMDAMRRQVERLWREIVA